MQGLAIRIAKTLNRLFNRAGQVWADRYHSHVLRTRREVADSKMYGITGFARDILDIADNLQRALDAIPAEARETADPGIMAFIEGVELTERGARVLSVSTDIGQGAITVFSQMAAYALGLPLDDVEVAENDTSKVPDSGPTVASRTTMVVGGTITKAALAMARILQSYVAEVHGVPAEEVACERGIFSARAK